MDVERFPILKERELVQDAGKDAPSKYHHKKVLPGTSGEGSPPLELIDIPTIDFALLTSPDPSVAKSEARKLGSALIKYCGFWAINHSLSAELVERMFGVVGEFFKLPAEQKLKHAREDYDHYEGYGFDKYPSDYAPHDWADMLSLKVTPERERNPKYWPNYIPTFKEVMDEGAVKSLEFLEIVLRGMAMALDLEDVNCFVEEVGEPRIYPRFNLYPPCTTPERVLGANEHTDPSVLTVLALDKDIEGTQVFLGGQWYRVPIKPDDHVIVMMGDQGEIMSNGVYPALMHRATVNAEKTRNTLAVFCVPGKEKSIGPVKGLIGKEGAARYKVCEDHATYVANHFQANFWNSTEYAKIR